MLVENPCGGVRWQTASDGRVDVEGLELPDMESDVAEVLAAWRPLIQQMASRYGVPDNWVTGVMTAESGFLASRPDEQARVVSPKGAVGLMQIMPGTAKQYGGDPDRLTDPTHNVMLGAKLLGVLRQKYKGQLPAVAAAYNAGGVYCSASEPWHMRSDPSYIGRVIAANNEALRQRVSATTGTKLVAGALAFSGLVLGAAIVTDRLRINP